MQKTIYRWLFFISALLLPIGSDGEIDSKKALTTSPAHPVLGKDQRHFPTANPLDRVKMPQIFRKILQKRFYTEGSFSKKTASKQTFWGRFITILFLAVAVVLLVYFLQGTIGLSFATLAIVSYWRNRDKIAAWESRPYARKKDDTPDKSEDKIPKNDANALNSSANKFTRRAIKRFAWGIGLIFLAFLVAIAAIFVSASVSAGILFILSFLFGYGFMVVSVVNALQAISAKEPQSSWAWLIVIFGIPLILSLLSFILAIGAL